MKTESTGGERVYGSKERKKERKKGEKKRKENMKEEERRSGKDRESERESPLAMETFPWFQCEADLKFISLFKGLFFCSRSGVFIFFFFFFLRTMTRRRRNPVFSRQLEHLLLLSSPLSNRGSGTFNFTWLHTRFLPPLQVTTGEKAHADSRQFLPFLSLPR